MSRKQPVLIGLNGAARSGKDTTADRIMEWCASRSITVARHGFADKLKESAAHALGVFENEIQFCNELKGDYQRGVITVHMATPGTGPGKTVASVTGREFLQYYGTEAHRDVFGSNFWVDALLPDTEGNYGRRFEEERIFEDSGSSAGAENLPDWWRNFRIGASSVADVCLITDCRFDNEAERIRELGGEIWRIERDGSGAGSAGKEGHASEIALPGELVNLVIDNNGSLQDLAVTVDGAMQDLMGVVA